MPVRQRNASSLLILLILAVGALLYARLYHPDLLPAALKPRPAGAAAAAQGDSALLAKEKEDRWQRFYRPHPACGRERTELERLECRNDRDIQRVRFEAQWRDAVVRGPKF